MNLTIAILSLLALVLVCGWLVARSATLRQWAEPDEGLVDLQTPPEEDGWRQNAEALVEHERVERVDLSRVQEAD